MFDTKWYLLYDNALMQSNKICFRKIGPRWKIFSISTSTFWLFTFKLVYDIFGHYKGNTLVSHYITRLSIKNSIYIFFITIKHNISWICSSHKFFFHIFFYLFAETLSESSLLPMTPTVPERWQPMRSESLRRKIPRHRWRKSWRNVTPTQMGKSRWRNS